MTHHVLVADDDPNMLDALADVVTSTGREVCKVRDGGELIEAIGDGGFDLVITDISMPWMSGLQAASSARYAGLPTPVIVVTALEDPSLDARVASLGSHARLLRKPIDVDDLERLIEELDPLTCGTV